MSGNVWEFRHSVECAAPREFVWDYWTNPANWDDPPARFEFDGPFAAGTRLTTIQPGEKLESVIRDVEQGNLALIEMDVAGASVRFRWTFESLALERTKITQTLSLLGAVAPGMVEQAKGLEQSVPEGMKKLALSIELSWRLRLGSARTTA